MNRIKKYQQSDKGKEAQKKANQKYREGKKRIHFTVFPEQAILIKDFVKKILGKK